MLFKVDVMLYHKDYHKILDYVLSKKAFCENSKITLRFYNEINTITTWRGNIPQVDDMTMVAIRV